MSRPHGRFRVDAASPEAKAVCDRCGFIVQLSDLNWQYQFVGPRLMNLRLYVCDQCLDKPQPNLRTIILPPDPTAVNNPRTENYVSDDNPMSAIGADANPFTPQYGNRIGTLTGGGGLNAAFDGNVKKPGWMSAANRGTLDSSYQSYVGINWQGAVNNLAMPSSLYPPLITHSLSAVTLVAPTDRGFLGSTATSYAIQCSPTDTALYGAWTTIYSGTTAGTAGETISVTITSTMNNPLSQFHRVAFLGNGTDYVAVAQVEFSVAEVGGTGEI